MNISSEVLQLQKEVSRLQRRVEHLETGLNVTRRELGLKGLKDDTPTFSFLQLPLEVRNRIYLYALMCTLYANLSPQYMDIYRPPTPGICRVNKQLSVEANEILYSRNTIHFDVPEDIHDCLEAIGNINKAHIRSISI